MHRKKIKLSRIFIILVALLLLITACDTTTQEDTPDAEITIEEFIPIVSATGEIVPERTALLSVKTGGVVAEVLVKEGEAVESGQILVRLEGTEQLQASVSAAQFELAYSQYALDSLYDDTNLLAAQALQAMDQAERALEDLLNPELQQALTLEAIANAKKAVEDAERRFTSVSSSADDADIEAQKA